MTDMVKSESCFGHCGKFPIVLHAAVLKLSETIYGVTVFLKREMNGESKFFRVSPIVEYDNYKKAKSKAYNIATYGELEYGNIYKKLTNDFTNCICHYKKYNLNTIEELYKKLYGDYVDKIEYESSFVFREYLFINCKKTVLAYENQPYTIIINPAVTIGYPNAKDSILSEELEYSSFKLPVSFEYQLDSNTYEPFINDIGSERTVPYSVISKYIAKIIHGDGEDAKKIESLVEIPKSKVVYSDKGIEPGDLIFKYSSLECDKEEEDE